MQSGSTVGRRRLAVAGIAILAAGLVPGTASASELIGRNATEVRLQADARGRALVSFRSEGQSKRLVAWGAVDARPPSRSRPQVAFSLQLGGSIGPNTCGAYRGPPLAWKVAACTAADGSHWAVQAWQRMLPNYGGQATGDRGAWELPALALARSAIRPRDLERLVVPALPPSLRAPHLSGRRRLRLRVDPLRRAARHVRPERLRRHARLGVRRGLEAGEQLPDAPAHRWLLLRLLLARRSRGRQRQALPGDRYRARRDSRRHVAGHRAGRVRRRCRWRGERGAAGLARARLALHGQLSKHQEDPASATERGKVLAL